MLPLPPDARASQSDECPCGRFATGRCKFCRVGFCDLHADLVDGQLYCAACDVLLHHAVPQPSAPEPTASASVANPPPPSPAPAAPGGPAISARPETIPEVTGGTGRSTPEPAATEPAPGPPAPEPWQVRYGAWQEGFLARMEQRVSGSGTAGLVLTTLGAELVYHDGPAGPVISIGWLVRHLPARAAGAPDGQHLVLPDAALPAGGVVATRRTPDGRVEAVADPTYAGLLFGSAVADAFVSRMAVVEARLSRRAAGVLPNRR